MSDQEPDRKDDEDDAPQRASRGRKLAEWVTLSVSALLVIGIAGYLGYLAMRGNDPYVGVDLRPLLDQVRFVEGQFILPIEVHNRGGRTLQGFRGEVTYHTRDGGAPERREFSIDYLGQGAAQKVYVYSRQDPSQVRVEAQPLDYRIE